MVYNNLLSQSPIPIMVYEKLENGEVNLINKNVKLSYKIIGQPDDSLKRIPLQDSIFKLEGNIRDWIEVRIIENATEKIHIRKVYPPFSNYTDKKISFYIGNTNYYFYRGLTSPLPIFPENIIYVEFDFGFENKFDTQSEIVEIDGLQETYLGNGHSGYKIIDSLRAKEIIRKISNVKYVKTISPVYKNQTLLTNRVEFLVDKTLSDKDAKQLFRVIGDDITEIWENPTNSFIWNYKEESLKAKVYVVHFNNESLATYDFISKLNEFMKNDKVLAVKMFSGMLLKLD